MRHLDSRQMPEQSSNCSSSSVLIFFRAWITSVPLGLTSTTSPVSRVTTVWPASALLLMVPLARSPGSSVRTSHLMHGQHGSLSRYAREDSVEVK